MTEAEVYAIMNKITALEPGKACIYFRGKSCWIEKISERMQKKLTAFFEAQASNNRIYFVQRRLSDTRISEYDYIAVRSKRLYH